MLRPSIGIDWDDVTAPFNSIAIRMANEKYHPEKPYRLEEITSWANEGRTSVIKEFYNDPELYSRQIPTEETKRGIRRLMQIADVFFITAVSPHFMGVRAEQIMTQFPELPPENIILGSAKDRVHFDIVLDDANIDYEALQKAVEVANISHEIEAMPQGYQTMIGEMGRGLSGGQRQRVLIARALYKDPDYLFLDEATNALDTINEQKIVRALNNVFKNRTVIVVAHRLSTIRRADQIIVLKAGMIIETGNHQSLMTNKQYYYNLIQSQYEPETNTFSTEESAD
jgi:ABC-type branched-subunit amino acid transport system ATPase component